MTWEARTAVGGLQLVLADANGEVLSSKALRGKETTLTFPGGDEALLTADDVYVAPLAPGVAEALSFKIQLAYTMPGPG